MNDRKPVILTKEQLRAQSEAAMKEAADRKLTIQHLESRKDVNCVRCGALNRVSIPAGQDRGEFTCKECGETQKSL